MITIPLLRPQIPDPSEWSPMLAMARMSGQWSNFGAIHNKAQKELSRQSKRLALPVTNGTVAVEIAAKIEFDPGMRIAVPNFTCAATVLAIIAAGCEPVIMPCDPRTWTISLSALADQKDSFDGLCVVSPFGYRVDFAAYDALAAELNKKIIYDLAGAWGMDVLTDHTYAMSFHATKNMCIGEGGAVFFSDPAKLNAAHQLIVFGFAENRETLWAQGINGKLDEIRSAVLLSQLSEANSMAIKNRVLNKKQLCGAYEAALGEQHAHGLYMSGAPSLCVFGGFNVDKLERMGASNGVQFKGYYHPLISDMHGFSTYKRFPDPDSEKFFRSCIAFPSDAYEREIHLVLELARRCSMI